MLEYTVLPISDMDAEKLQKMLNVMAMEGWRVVCNTLAGMIFERERHPSISVADGVVTLTYG